MPLPIRTDALVSPPSLGGRTGNDSVPPVLMVEDDPNDVLFTQMAWTEEGICHPLIVCENGQDAIEYLSGTGPYRDRGEYRFPCLLLTDLQMPVTDGFGLLAWLQEDPRFDGMPKIVLSSSVDEERRFRAFVLGASDYVIKPITIPERAEVIRELVAKWLTQSPVQSRMTRQVDNQ